MRYLQLLIDAYSAILTLSLTPPGLLLTAFVAALLPLLGVVGYVIGSALDACLSRLIARTYQEEQR